MFCVSRGWPKWAGLLVTVAALVGCGGLGRVTDGLPSVSSLVTPYRTDIIQGNFVSREQAAALVVGMPRTQVRDILGTPLLTSVFHANRWDYVFTLRKDGQAPQQRRLTVFFANDRLDRIEADDLPTEAEFVASLDAKSRNLKAPVLQASEASLKAFAQANKPAPEVAEEPVPSANKDYPPLEPPSSATLGKGTAP